MININLYISLDIRGKVHLSVYLNKEIWSLYMPSLSGECHMLGSFSYASPEGEILGNYASSKSANRQVPLLTKF